MKWIYVAMWIGVAVAVIVGIIVTKNVSCLWAFCIPMFVTIITSDEEEIFDKINKLDNDNFD